MVVNGWISLVGYMFIDPQEGYVCSQQ